MANTAIAPPPLSAPTRALPGGGLPVLLALLAGNFITGVVVLAPTAMLTEIAAGLHVSEPAVGLLMTFGAVVLCLGSPLLVWATATQDRRVLLAASLALVGLGHLGAALAPSYPILLVLRLMMLVAAAIFTPQAASTVALLVPERRRASAISLVFLGWSLSVAAGLPLVTLVADHFGWRAAYGVLGLAALLVCAYVAVTTPSGLRSAPLSIASWGRIIHNRRILLLLSITPLWMAGYFTVFAYMGPLLARLTGASPSIIAGCFALIGVMGFLGNVGATRLVDRLGPFPTALAFMVALLSGTAAWAVGAGSLPVMGLGAALMGLGFAAFNSIQQGRLVSESPAFASASVALNTSCVYIGQAIGSGIAVMMFSHGMLVAMGYVATAFMVAALGVLALTRHASVRPTAVAWGS